MLKIVILASLFIQFVVNHERFNVPKADVLPSNELSKQPSAVGTVCFMKEIWEDIVGYNGLYKVSNFGKIMSFRLKKNGKLCSLEITNLGYKRVTLFNSDGVRKRYSVHRLVAITFIPNPENKPEVNHLNSNPGDNRVNNLEWCTRIENEQHSYKIGEKKTILTAKQVNEIRLLQGKKTTRAVASLFGIGKSEAHRIMSGKGYKFIPYPLDRS